MRQKSGGCWSLTKNSSGCLPYLLLQSQSNTFKRPSALDLRSHQAISHLWSLFHCPTRAPERWRVSAILVKLPNTQRPQDLAIWYCIHSESALVGECEYTCRDGRGETLHFPQDGKQDGAVISSSMASPLWKGLSTECKWIAFFHSYFSASHPTYILCLKAQTPMLQTSLKPEQDVPQVYLHMTHRERQKYSFMTPVREIFFLIIDYIFTLFLSAVKTILPSQERGTWSALCARS